MLHNFPRGRVLLYAVVLAVAFATAPALAGTMTGELNINTASAEALTLLPGVGELRSEQIVALRKQRGGFERADDLLAVKGIGEKRLETLRPFIKLEGEHTLEIAAE